MKKFLTSVLISAAFIFSVMSAYGFVSKTPTSAVFTTEDSSVICLVGSDYDLFRAGVDGNFEEDAEISGILDGKTSVSLAGTRKIVRLSGDITLYSDIEITADISLETNGHKIYLNGHNLTITHNYTGMIYVGGGVINGEIKKGYIVAGDENGENTGIVNGNRFIVDTIAAAPEIVLNDGSVVPEVMRFSEDALAQNAFEAVEDVLSENGGNFHSDINLPHTFYGYNLQYVYTSSDSGILDIYGRVSPVAGTKTPVTFNVSLIINGETYADTHDYTVNIIDRDFMGTDDGTGNYTGGWLEACSAIFRNYISSYYNSVQDAYLINSDIILPSFSGYSGVTFNYIISGNGTTVENQIAGQNTVKVLKVAGGECTLTPTSVGGGKVYTGTPIKIITDLGTDFYKFSVYYTQFNRVAVKNFSDSLYNFNQWENAPISFINIMSSFYGSSPYVKYEMDLGAAYDELKDAFKIGLYESSGSIYNAISLSDDFTPAQFAAAQKSHPNAVWGIKFYPDVMEEYFSTHRTDFVLRLKYWYSFSVEDTATQTVSYSNWSDKGSYYTEITVKAFAYFKGSNNNGRIIKDYRLFQELYKSYASTSEEKYFQQADGGPTEKRSILFFSSLAAPHDEFVSQLSAYNANYNGIELLTGTLSLNVESMSISEANVTNFISKLTSLQKLYIKGAGYYGAGNTVSITTLTIFETLKNLKVLSITNANIAFFDNLDRFPYLEELYIYNNNASAQATYGGGSEQTNASYLFANSNYYYFLQAEARGLKVYYRYDTHLNKPIDFMDDIESGRFDAFPLDFNFYFEDTIYQDKVEEGVDISNVYSAISTYFPADYVSNVIMVDGTVKYYCIVKLSKTNIDTTRNDNTQKTYTDSFFYQYYVSSNKNGEIGNSPAIIFYRFNVERISPD